MNLITLFRYLSFFGGALERVEFNWVNLGGFMELSGNWVIQIHIEWWRWVGATDGRDFKYQFDFH